MEWWKVWSGIFKKVGGKLEKIEGGLSFSRKEILVGGTVIVCSML